MGGDPLSNIASPPRLEEEKGNIMEDFILLLNEYCSDHREHFGCYPLEFEHDGKVYTWDEFCEYIL